MPANSNEVLSRFSSGRSTKFWILP